MRNLLRFIAFVLMVGSAYAQSKLPACPSSGYFHNCFGTHTLASGSKYVGEYKDGKPDGQGTATLANGNKYVGEFKDNNFNGQGTFTFANGNKYVGEFKDGKRNGQGTYTIANGERYVGEYRDDKPNGQGAYTFPNGNKYVGELKDGTYNGQGTFTFANGNKYVGEWKDGKRNGQGASTFPKGNKFVGEWKDDERNGQGTFTFANGNKYVGEWKDDKANGQGAMYSSNGSITNQGIWADGNFVRPAPVQLATAPTKVKPNVKAPESDGFQLGPHLVSRSFPQSGETYTFSLKLGDAWELKDWSLKKQQTDNQLLGLVLGTGNMEIVELLDAQISEGKLSPSNNSSGEETLSIKLNVQAMNTRNLLMTAKMRQRDRQQELDKISVINDQILKKNNIALRKAFDTEKECTWAESSFGAQICKAPLTKNHQSKMGVSVSMLDGVIVLVPLLDGHLTVVCSLVEARLPMSQAAGHRARHEATVFMKSECEKVLKSLDIALKN
jgi:hypothetical protein